MKLFAAPNQKLIFQSPTYHREEDVA